MAIMTQDSAQPEGGHRRRGWRAISYFLLGLLLLWACLGLLATIPLVGAHPYWRTFRAEPEDFGLKAEDVSFLSSDGIKLSAWLIRAQGAPRASIIIAHGINGNRSDMLSRAAFLVHDGYDVLLVDMRGHGKSGGDYAAPGYLEALDVIASVKYLESASKTEETPATKPPSNAQEEPPQSRIVAMGHSYGAVAALYAAAADPRIAAVIADSAYISFQDMRSRATTLLAQDPESSFWFRIGLRLADSRAAELAVMPFYFLRTGVWVNSSKSNAVDAIHRIGDRPILFIAGDCDEICPASNAQLMYAADASTKKGLLIVPGAAHDSTFATNPQLYESTVEQFLQRAL
jgi:uncharacterized protein